MNVKDFDFKEFAVAHGEKMVLGLAGLLVLLALGKTTWSTYDKAPAEITTKAEDAQATIEQSEWPEEERERFSAKNRLHSRIESMLQPVRGRTWRERNGGGLAFSISPTWSLYVKEKPLEVPELYPVQNLIATPLRMVVAKRTARSLDETGKPTDDDDGGYRADTKKPKPGSFKVGTGEGGEGGEDSGLNASPEEYPSYSDNDDGTGGTDAEGIGESGSTVEGEGHHVVAVRGIVRIRDQLRAYEEALNLPENLDPRRVIDIFDFTLERQVSTDGGETWRAWEPVDLESNAKFLFFEVDGFETPVVHQGVTHPVITSPLPMRLLRHWGDEATHPDIANFKLSKKGREKQRIINEIIAQRAAELRKRRRNQRRGFARILRDPNEELQNIYSDDRSRQRFQTDLHQRFNADGENPDAVTQIQNEVTAAGDLLLFRYFDFDVLPGLAYQYRVRLQLRNPLFEIPIEKVALNSQTYVNKPLLTTPDSTPRLKPVLDENGQPVLDKNGEPVKKPVLDDNGHPSNQAIVPQDTHLFVKRVGRDRGALLQLPEPAINLEVFQWFSKPGTTIRGELKALHPGQFVAGKDEKTKQLDPAQQILRSDVPQDFETANLLLDADDGYRNIRISDLNAHLRELGLSRLRKGLDVDEGILLIDQRGQVKELSQSAQQDKRDTIAKAHDKMMTTFASWEQKTEDTAPEDGDGYYDEGGALGVDQFEGEEDGGEGRLRRRRRPTRKSSSPLRRRRFSRGGSADDDYVPPYPIDSR